MVAEILGPDTRLAHNRAGANLVSGVASALLDADGAELGLFEVDEAALPEVARRLRPRAVCLLNLFRDQLDRYGELELVAERWRAAVRALDPHASVIVNGDDPQLGGLASDREEAVVFGVDDPRCGRADPTARGRLEVLHPLRHSLRLRRGLRGHLGDYRCPRCGHARPPLDVVARNIELVGLESAAFDLVTPQGTPRVRLRLPGLYNVYNALAAAALTQTMGIELERIQAGLERFSPAFGRFERIALGDRNVLILLIKNPAGANEVVRTLVDAGVPPYSSSRSNDGIADGRRRLLDLGRRFRTALRARARAACRLR